MQQSLLINKCLLDSFQNSINNQDKDSALPRSLYRDTKQKLFFSPADKSIKYKAVIVTMLSLNVDVKQVLGIILNDGVMMLERT